MFDALVNPDAFFRERADDPSLGRPALVVLAVGVIGLVSVLAQWQVAQASVPANTRSLVGLVLGVSAVWALLQPFLGWAVFALIYYGISGLFEGEGSYRDTLALAGYGYLPRILGAVVALALSLAASPSTSGGAAAATSPLTIVSSVLSWVFLAWQGFVTTYAVKHARSLSLRHAAISVWVPVGLLLLFHIAAFVIARLILQGVGA